MKLYIILVALILPASAQVLEISKLEVNVFVAENAHVVYNFTLKNNIKHPVVPGIGEIRLQKVEPVRILMIPIPFTEKRLPVDVENIKAYSGRLSFKTSVEKFEEYTVVYYEIWYPIEPEGSMEFTLEFYADIVDRGILFKSISIPVGTNLDIGNLTVNIDSDWNKCYLEPKSYKGKLPANSLIFFDAEFSILPLPILPFKGYILFWGTLIVVALLIIAISVAKKKKSEKK